MTRTTDAKSQSRQRPQTADRPSGTEQPQASGDPTLPTPQSHPEIEHSGPSSGSSSFSSFGPEHQFNALEGTQNNNTGSGNQFSNTDFRGPVHIGDVINHPGPTRNEKEKKILKRLYTSPYQDRKNRNPDRVTGTCDWFVSHELFRKWQESESSRPLWVSADPGCGKSVLAKYLVDSVLRATESRTVCYFFFKDDFEDQRNVISALCCLLYQLFMHKRLLLSDAILDRFDICGETLTSSFNELWQILIDAAQDENAGEIICILDAIDECENQGRHQLAQALCKLDGTGGNFNLKFLLTSRPYGEIRRGFQLLETQKLAVIHLSGESDDEIRKISQEIDVFIKIRVQGIGAQLRLTQNEQGLLLQELMRIPNRTYLWVHLTLDLIKDDIDINKTRIIEATSHLPKSVNEAYDRILFKSRNSEKAKKILHIIVAAARPLTLAEMTLALVLQENHRSYDDLDLEPEDRFRERVRDICGLIVTIIDSRIYLLHQTVREFLVQKNRVNSPGGIQNDMMDSPEGIQRAQWKHSLRPLDSHHILARICIWHLLLAEFETHPLNGNEQLPQYIKNHVFLDYSAKHWAAHLRELPANMQDAMTQSILRICDTSLKRFQTWFGIYWTSRNTDFPAGFTTLMVTSYFGLETAVTCLLGKDDIDLNSLDNTHRRSALSWAAENGFDAVVKALIKGTGLKLKLLFWKKAKVNSADRYGRTPLSYAVWSGNVVAVKLLVKAGARVDLKDEIGGTPLSYALCSGHEKVIKLLLKKGTQVGSVDEIGKELLFSAAKKGHEAVVERLLETDIVSPQAKDNDGLTPLSWAASNGHEAVVKLLLDKGADLNSKDDNSWTPLLRAAENGHEVVVKQLLVEKANINVQDVIGATALHWVAWRKHKAVMSLLLKNQAEIEIKEERGGTPLAWAIESGFKTGIEMLLAKDAEVNYWYTLGPYYRYYDPRDDDRRYPRVNNYDGLTPLMRAVERKDETTINLLLEKGAAPDSLSTDGRSPLSVARDTGNRTIIKLLESYCKHH